MKMTGYLHSPATAPQVPISGRLSGSQSRPWWFRRTQKHSSCRDTNTGQTVWSAASRYTDCATCTKLNYTYPLFYAPLTFNPFLCINAPFKYTWFLNLRPFIFGLTPFGCLRYFTLIPASSTITYRNIIFVFILCVCLNWEGRGVYREIKGKRQLGRSRLRWEDNIKADLQEVGCGGRTGLSSLR
jgi:hypothetical protein